VVGELLLAVVALARAAGVDPEAALREAARGYAGRVRAAEAATPSE
jgi:XTP/dITP diphosphohydrolase